MQVTEAQPLSPQGNKSGEGVENLLLTGSQVMLLLLVRDCSLRSMGLGFAMA